MTDKKKLNHFLSDLLKLGCVKGFKFFATHLRGREEMICSVINEPSISILSASNSPANSFALRDSAMPKEPGNILISQKRQRRLSGYGFINVGLPPASPAESEEDMDENSTMFLIAGYARYNRPYVWVRSNHERLVTLSSEKSKEKDFPLLLKSTSSWTETDIKVWDVLAELVTICTSPSPPNPFAVDMDYFEALDLPERVLASAAMTNFLLRLLSSGTHTYDRRVQSDLLKVCQLHFQAVLQLSNSQTSLSAVNPLQSLQTFSSQPYVQQPHEALPPSLVQHPPQSHQSHATPPASQQFHTGRATINKY